MVLDGCISVNILFISHMAKVMMERNFGRNLRHDVLAIHEPEHQIRLLQHGDSKPIVAYTRRTDRVQRAVGSSESGHRNGGEGCSQAVARKIDGSTRKRFQEVVQHWFDFRLPYLIES